MDVVLCIDAAVTIPQTGRPSVSPSVVNTQAGTVPPLPLDTDLPECDDGSSSLAARRPRRAIRLPKRFLDAIPQPPASLPSLSVSPSAINTYSSDVAENLETTTLASSSSWRPVWRVLDSPRNLFQIFRRYHAVEFPSHDPEEELHLAQLSDIAEAHEDISRSMVPSTYGPYPNRSSFLLGEWYWNLGSHISANDFQDLLKVLSDRDFHVDGLGGTQWNLINRQLGSLGSEDARPWPLDWDAGWVQEPVVLTIPFHERTANPGNKTFRAKDFYCRSIIAILRERLARADSHHFHYEPYELFWEPHHDKEPIRVYGELYTSREFNRIHQELQNSPPEPGCKLPHVVVGLMFSSDTTHLTQFGDAKLWPIYLFFGNDSKYRRCKPSSHLCNHLAYLQKVSLFTSRRNLG